MATGVTTESRPAPVQIEHEGFTVRSNSGTVEDLNRDLGVEQAEPEPEPTPEPEPAPLKSGEIAKRIAKTTYDREEATRAATSARQEADAAKAELARLRAERANPDPRRSEDEQQRYETWKAGHDAQDPKPVVSAFDDHDAYLDARDAWNERRIDRRSERAQDERQHHERQSRVREAAGQFQSRLDAEVAKDPGFKAIIDRVQIPAGPILDVFLTTDIPEALARHLDSKPDVLQSLIRMRPGQQLAEIKRIEGYLQASLELRAGAAQAGSAPPAKVTTTAHPPINPVVGSHVAASDEEPGDDASDAEWFAYQDRHARKRRP